LQKQANFKNKPNIGYSIEKQSHTALAGKFNTTKNQQENQIKNRVTNPKKQAQNEHIFTTARPICL